MLDDKKEEGGKEMAVLTEEDVKYLLRRKAEGTLNVREAAAFHEVSVETIRRAMRGETWTYLQIQGKRRAAWEGKY